MKIEYTKASGTKPILVEASSGDTVRIDGEPHIVTDEFRHGQRVCCQLCDGMLYSYPNDQEATPIEAMLVVEGSEDDE